MPDCVLFLRCLQYGTRHIIETMRLSGQNVDLVVMCGGLAKNKLYVQTHADILGLYLYICVFTMHLSAILAILKILSLQFLWGIWPNRE